MLIDAMTEDKRPKDGIEMIEHKQQPPVAVPKALGHRLGNVSKNRK
jgi:hypothetical protein